MKKSKCLILCAVLTASMLFAMGCGNNDNNNMNGTEAPYDDETDQKVNDTSDNGAVENDLEQSGDSLKDAGKNLIDSVEETGDAIRDGIDNLGNDVRDDVDGTNNTNNANDENRVESEDMQNNDNVNGINGVIEENGSNDMDVAP